MRKLFAILLLTAFMLPFASPLLALGQDGEVTLPACCRREGRHHCVMSTAERDRLRAPKPDAANAPQWQAPIERCPYGSAFMPALSHTYVRVAQPMEVIFASLVSHPSGSVQTECKRRISLDRARGKRGPPASSLA